ncbi:ribbon-helix-helix protein, CopG family [Streptomyces parvus]|uniref:ribbon-helix-helix protein, CopG family n=1 Tax=Streptomyces parvus TaxID=66428 RepID=UPI003D720D99
MSPVPFRYGLNLRLRDDQTEALKRRAEQEGISMHALVLRAVDDYLARTAQQAIVRKTAKEQAAKWSELMERLK